jgi:hypothetical protein
MNPQEFLDGGTVKVEEPTYAVCRADDPVPAAVAADLAEAGVSVFALSAHPADHVPVRHTDLDVALQQLGTLGCAVV